MEIPGDMQPTYVLPTQGDDVVNVAALWSVGVERFDLGSELRVGTLTHGFLTGGVPSRADVSIRLPALLMVGTTQASALVLVFVVTGLTTVHQPIMALAVFVEGRPGEGLPASGARLVMLRTLFNLVHGGTGGGT